MSRLNVADALDLLQTADLPSLGAMADAVTENLHPGNVRTYNVERNINYTNVCVSRCKFCAFCRNENDTDAYILDEPALLAKIDETIQHGGRQILLQGGLHPTLPFEWYENLLKTIKRNFPDVNIHGFSPTEIAYFADMFDMTELSVLERLRYAGLDSIPGGGAEILADRVRQIISPKKVSAKRWLHVNRLWHRLGGRSSATMMFGHLETIEERVLHLEHIRSLQDESLQFGHTGFTAFIPWTLQPGHTELAHLPKVSVWEYLRFLAVSRLFLDNIPTIQASWVTQGLQMGTLGLSFGADDLGSVMLEENVVSATGTVYVPDASRSMESAFCEAILSAGYTPQRRTGLGAVRRQVCKQANRPGDSPTDAPILLSISK